MNWPIEKKERKKKMIKGILAIKKTKMLLEKSWLVFLEKKP